MRAYLFYADQLDLFEHLEAGEKLEIKDVYIPGAFAFYNLWLQECGTALWNKTGSVIISGKVCGPETIIQHGEPTGLFATQTAMAYPVEPAPTPLVTPQFTEHSGGLSGLYLHSSEEAQWTESIPDGKTHYIHTLLRFYEDGLVLGTYLEHPEVNDIGYVTSELINELHHFNRYNTLGKPNENGIYRGGESDFYIPGTLYQRRFAYGRYYIEDDQIWFTLTNDECHHSTITQLEWEGSREYVGIIHEDVLQLKTYSLRGDHRSDVEATIYLELYGHMAIEVINGKFIIQRDTEEGAWNHIETGAEQTFQRVEID